MSATAQRRTPLAVIIVVAVVIIAAIIYFATRRASLPGEPDAIKVGVVLPLTGALAQPGTSAPNGLKLAIEQFNSQKPARGIQLIVEDSQSNPSSGVSAATKLIELDGVKVIIGDIMSSIAMAIAPIAERNQVVLFAPGASNPRFPGIGDYVFRNWASDDYDAKVMATYLLTEHKFESGGVVYVNNDYGLGLAQAFRKSFEARGGSVLVYESYSQGATDFRPIIAKITAHPTMEFLYIPGQPVENGHLVKQLRENGVELFMAANLSVESPEFLNVVGGSGAGILFTTPVFEPNEAGMTALSFGSAYERAYGTAPDVTAGHAYDAGRILILALEECSFDLAKLRDSLAEVQNFPGVTGKTSFTQNGDVRKDVLIKVMEASGSSRRIGKYNVEPTKSP